ncbi:UbiA family prenyltransferase [Salinactinospora qingdaonensis]|uniref:1,4-dihydroxy-2-naphthoate octaprenyltransferase n=1 Tax=Salinactinospora qingdaonensis TaxID=702744 RepID=A0ABP7GHG5_9ACTN
MTDELSPAPPAAPATSLRERVNAYARLAKLDIVDYYFGLAVVWSLLPAAAWFDPRTIAVLALFLVGEVLLVAAMTAFDDVTGYRDGSDAVNYGPNAPLRRLVRKPLLAGTLTQAQAVRFGWLSAAATIVVWGGAVALAPRQPLWAVAVMALCLFCSVQYSWGLRISYRGAQELFLIGLGVGLVTAPYGLLAGGLDGFVLAQAVIFGFGPLLFGVFSNTNDIEGDARVGRPTVAVLAARAGKNGRNAAFIAAVCAAETCVIWGAAAVGVAPLWFPLIMAPVTALRVGQLLIGFRSGDILRARNLGIRTHRVSVVLLIAANLTATLLPGAAA